MALEDQSMQELVAELVRGARELIREEARLAQAEMHRSFREARRGLTWLMLAAIPGMMALVVVPLTVVYGFDELMPRWVAGLIVSVVLLMAAGVMAAVGVKHFKRTDTLPKQTIETVREDAQWLRNHLS